jgi:RHS repeat-associated protein
LRDSEWLTGPVIPPLPELPEQSTTYNTNAVNQLLSTVTPDQLFDYDDDGNMVQGYTKDGYQFTATYDAENRMTSIQFTDGGGTVHRQEFLYSGDDLVAEQKRYENGTLVDTIRVVRDGMLALQDRDAGNAVVQEYTWGLNLGGGIGGLLNLHQSGQDYAYLYDGKGNVEAVLDAAQAVVAGYRYDPFGVLLAKTGSFEQSYGFSTKRYDEQIGMLQYEYRSYLPEVGRWSTRDPLGEAGGMNLYAFVGNNPVNWVDPSGLFVIGTFYREQGKLVVFDFDTKKTTVVENVFSGSGHCTNDPACEYKKDEGPIPEGVYLIGQEYYHKGSCSVIAGNCMWYKLYGPDGEGGFTYEEIPFQDPLTGEEVTRGDFNLHTGLYSEGCVTVTSEVGARPIPPSRAQKVGRLVCVRVGFADAACRNHSAPSRVRSAATRRNSFAGVPLLPLRSRRSPR